VIRLAWRNPLDDARKFTHPTPVPKVEFGVLPGEGETVFYVAMD